MSKCFTKNKQTCQGNFGCKFFQFFVQSSFAFMYGLVYYLIITGPSLPVKKPQGKFLGSYKYLTFWGLHFQLLVSILNVLVILTSCNKITKFRNVVHHAFSAPFGCLVFFMFWSLYHINRDFVFPKEIEPYFPPLLNHVTHTLVLITPIYNELTIYNEKKCNPLVLTLIALFAYCGVLLYFGYVLDYWIYQIFDFLNTTGKFTLIGLILLITVFIYKIYDYIHKLRWSDKIKQNKKKQN